MAESVFRHNDDEGALSVFASGDEILFACSKGHWWIVDAKESGKTDQAASRRARQGDLGDRLTSDDVKVRDLTSRFGSGVLKAMKLE